MKRMKKLISLALLVMTLTATIHSGTDPNKLSNITLFSFDVREIESF